MQYQQKRKYSRAVSLAAYVALIAYLIISTLAHPYAEVSSIVIIGIKCFPLLGFALAMYKQHLRQLAWMCFVLLIYFTIEIMYVAVNGALGALIITLLYTSTMLHIRWHNRANEEADAI
ncbi:MAG: DUF2069 domain-containing protein [Gammaproteobacteria bacterium]|nr:DUF2069 domain-containing protein [Gammaproteobacteria bacterium]